jgi:hypothetical protein
MLKVVKLFMSRPSATLVLLALLVVGCATKEQQPTAAQTARVEKYDKSGWGALRTSNRLGSDHINIASGEFR